MAVSIAGARLGLAADVGRESQRRVQDPPPVTVTPTVAPDTMLSLAPEISSVSFLDCFCVVGLIRGYPSVLPDTLLQGLMAA